MKKQSSSESLRLYTPRPNSRPNSRPQSPLKSPRSREIPEPPPTILRSLAVCLLYGFTSISITFFNKAIFSVYAFRFPCFVTLLQILVSIIILSVAALLHRINLPAFSRETVRLVYPLSLCWWTYVVSGIAALRHLNIPMFSTLRKATALIVLVLEAVVLRKRAKPSIWICILVMVAGGVIAGATDLSFSLIGYILVGICSVATALYLILIVKVGKRTNLDTFGLLFYNNIISLPLMLIYMLLFSDEFSNVHRYPYITDAKFWAFLLFSAAQATLLNIAIFMCTKLNSPLATTVTGQIKDLITVGFGLFVFGDVTLSGPNLLGLGVSLVGSMGFSLIKLLHARRAKSDNPSAK